MNSNLEYVRSQVDEYSSWSDIADLKEKFNMDEEVIDFLNLISDYKRELEDSDLSETF